MEEPRKEQVRGNVETCFRRRPPPPLQQRVSRELCSAKTHPARSQFWERMVLHTSWRRWPATQESAALAPNLPGDIAVSEEDDGGSKGNLKDLADWKWMSTLTRKGRMDEEGWPVGHC